MNKHTSRLPTTGEDSPRYRGTQLWMRMLAYKPEMRFKVKLVRLEIHTSLPDGVSSGSRIYGDGAGDVYIEDDKAYVVLADESDAEELAAGQVGPMG